jgi:hypothetical protein
MQNNRGRALAIVSARESGTQHLIHAVVASALR